LRLYPERWFVSVLLQDLRYALRQLRKNFGVALAVIFVLAVGIAANSVTFTILEAALLRPLPYPDPDRLVQVWETRTTGAFTRMEASYPDFADFRDGNTVFEKLGGYSQVGLTTNGPDGTEQAYGCVVSGNFFDVLGVRPSLGRVFTAGEESPQSERTVMLSYAGWQRRFGGDPQIVGRTIVINDLPRILIGILPRDFQFAPSGAAEFWLPARAEGFRLRRNLHWFHPVGRLKPGIDLAKAQSGMAALAKGLEQQYPDSNAGVGVQLVSLREQIVGSVRPVMLLLMTAVGFLLLITCGNLAGLLLIQAVARQKEMSIRLAIGASRWRIVRQLLTESCLLALLGGVAGAALSKWLLPLAMSMLPKEALRFMPAWQDLRVDAGFLLFAMGLALVTGVLFGLAPALVALRPGLRETLHESGASTSGRGRTRIRGVLVVAEIAMAIVMLYGAGVMLKSLSQVLRVDPGFWTANLLTLDVGLGNRDDAQSRAFHRDLMARLSALPGVTGVATISTLPLTGGGNTSIFVREGHRTSGNTEDQEANSREISANYFSVMGVPLHAGRFFSESDEPSSPHVAIINQTLAERMFPGESPIGKRIDFTYTKDPNIWEIVGIVGDENATALDAKPNPIIYTPFLQSPDSGMSVVVRTAYAPESLGVAAQRAIHELDAKVTVSDVQSMTQLIDNSPSIFLRRLPAYLIAAFAGVGLLLAVVGLYSLLAHSVAQRSRELGIRVALGAQQRNLLALVMSGGLRLVLAGLGIGIAAALAVGKLLASFLFNVQPGDPLTLAGVAALLLLVCLLAIYNPARRAAATDPMRALRAE
jgi:predicted permease